MKWVTRKGIHVNRTATAWLIKRFLDPDAEIIFVEPDDVASVQQREGAVGFDAPGARYPHRDEKGRCSFEQLVDERLSRDVALHELARIVHGADFPDQASDAPEADRRWVISSSWHPRSTPLSRPCRRAASTCLPCTTTCPVRHRRSCTSTSVATASRRRSPRR